MKGSFRKPGCKCEDKKKCKCGATWSFILDIGPDPVTGKRRQKEKSGFRTKKEAERACAEMIVQLEEGTFIQETEKTFGSFALEWLKMYATTGRVKVSTVRVRKHEISCLSFYFDAKKLKDISKSAYQEALNDMKKRGIAENTISGIHGTGRMIFKKAMELDLIKNDPTVFASPPRAQKTVEEIEIENTLEKYLEKEELVRFLTAAKEKGMERDYIIFLVLSYTGMRAGELCALKWKDIDFEEGTINISKTYYNPNNNTTQYQLLTPKTKKSRRIIEIDETVIKELKSHKARQNEIKMENRLSYHDEGFIIAKEKKNPGYPEFIKTIENRMVRLLKLSGLNPELTPHSLRHTHTSLLAEADVSLEEIMDRLGHSDDETTKNVYLHVTKTMKKEAARKFGDLMNKAKTGDDVG